MNYKIFLIFILFKSLSFEIVTNERSSSKSHKIIGDKNSTTSNNYHYIKEKSGKYLRWDGNVDYLFRGLYFDSELRDDYRNDWYLFSLEVSEINKTIIRNVKTNTTLDLAITENFYVLTANFIDIMDFDISKNNDNIYFKIQANNKSYLSVKNKFQAMEKLDIYSIDSTLNDSEAAEVIFVTAENQSISSDSYIIGTNLTQNTYYCIQSQNKQNETTFLKFNGINYESHSGLSLSKTDDNQCPNSVEYFFELEFNEDFNWIGIKNKASNKYIGVYSDNTFALTDDLNNKYIVFKMNLMTSTSDHFIRIRTKFLSFGGRYVYLGNSPVSWHYDKISGAQNFQDSGEFTFIYMGERNNTEIITNTVSSDESSTYSNTETTTGSKAYKILFDLRIILLFNFSLILKIFHSL